MGSKRGLGGALALLLVVVAVFFVASSTSWAQRMGYRLQNRVSVGDKPLVVLQPGEDLKKVELVLKRSDGQVQKFVRKNLKANKEVEIAFKQPPGKFDYTATLKMTTAAGSSEVSFEFDAIVAKRVTVQVNKEDSDVGQGHVAITVDGPVTHADLVVSGDEGVIDERQIDISGARPGESVALTWTPKEGQTVRRINVKVHDAAGFWTGLELIPFSVSIPHEEVTFDSGKATFQPSEAVKLDKTLKLITAEIEKYGKDLEINLYVVGYTDTVGARDANINLSYNRARAIAAYFRQKGLKVPIYYQGFGEDVLAVATADNVDEPRNRRALYILGNVSPPKSGQIPRSDWRRLQ